ncbi:MAG: multicopper oxidase domain-containing protein [Phycisphaerae bacterium]|nr:multicopper oxidase domain-containing protein [Phycisphaerae bacterium]
MRMKRGVVRGAMAGLVLAASVSASGQTQNVSLRASHDNTLYEDGFGLTSNGKGQYMFVGVNGGSVKRRGIIRFDVSAIPPGSTITSVTLTMNMSRSNAGVQSVALHRVLAGWGEGSSDAGAEEGSGATAKPGDATWIHRLFPDTFWTNAGGDFAPGASASTSVNTGSTSWSSSGMVADVQSWVNSGATNFGWVLKGNEVGSRTAKRFDSREHPTPSRRPVLNLTYTGAPPLSGACCLPSGDCAITLAGQCENQGGTYQGNGAGCSPNPCPPPPTGGCCNPTTGACTTTTALNCAATGGVYLGDNVSCSPNPCPPGLVPFVDALPIPAVATPTTGVAGGAAHYDMVITRFTQKLHRDLPPTTVYGYAGTYPGPTIEAHAGQPVTVRWVNDLRSTSGQLLTTHDLLVDECLHGPDAAGPLPLTVTHLHGGHVPASSDGYPEDTFGPGSSSAVYDYPNNQRGATLWYHDHALGITRLNVYMGLAGFYLLRDATDDALNLPRGEYEIPLVIQDRSFFQDGRLKYNDIWMEHFFGDFILVNGKVWPFLNVAQGKYRFRLLNGSGSRAYTLSLSNGRPITQIGSDGGLLGFPVPRMSVTILPGERADVVIDFAGIAPGTSVILQNSAPAPFPGEDGVGVVPNVMKFVVGSQPGHTDAVPATLSPVTPIPASTALRERPLVLRTVPFMCMHASERDFVNGTGHGETMWAINDLMWDDIVERPRLGTTEIWSWINRSNITHPMHMHLVEFQVLNRQAFTVVDGVPTPTGPIILPPPEEKGWKDTVQSPPGMITRVIAKFEHYTGLFSYHCHILEHEDNEMMRQFLSRPECRGDANDDGVVNFADVTTVLAQFGATGPRGIQGDANLNGFVDFGDVTTVLANFGNSCL